MSVTCAKTTRKIEGLFLTYRDEGKFEGILLAVFDTFQRNFMLYALKPSNFGNISSMDYNIIQRGADE